MEELIEVLEKSVEKHGEKPLTNLYLLNIIKLSQRIEIHKRDRIESELDESLMQLYADQCGDRD